MHTRVAYRSGSSDARALAMPNRQTGLCSKLRSAGRSLVSQKTPGMSGVETVVGRGRQAAASQQTTVWLTCVGSLAGIEAYSNFEGAEVQPCLESRAGESFSIDRPPSDRHSDEGPGNRSSSNAVCC